MSGWSKLATIEQKGIDDLVKQLQSLGDGITGTCKRAVYPAAGMLADAIKAACPKDSGDLKDSVALVKFVDENGYVYTRVTFDGYDRNGTPNILKARVLESGRSTPSGGITGKHPFVRNTVNRMKSQCLDAIRNEFERAIDEKMNK